MSTRTLTKYHPQLLSEDYAQSLFLYFQDNITWDDGIKSKDGFTRKAKAMTIGMDRALDTVILDVINKLNIDSAAIYGIYLNYYRNGNDYTPNHSHPGMRQVVISLGTTRTLSLGKNMYNMNNGDVIIFGSSIHGVPKDNNCINGRISIALFLSK